MSEGGEARNHEEVEAVATALDQKWVSLGNREGLFGSVGLLGERSKIMLAESAIAALDAVRRSQQGEDYAQCGALIDGHTCRKRAGHPDDHLFRPDLVDAARRAPLGEDPDGGFDSAAGETRSWPQGEDHEAGNRGAGFTERMSSELETVAGWNRPSPVSDTEPDTATETKLVEAAQAVADVHQELIRAVTPGDPEFLHAQGPNAIPDERDRYDALFSRWHSTTRALGAALAGFSVDAGKAGDEGKCECDLGLREPLNCWSCSGPVEEAGPDGR